MSNWIFAGFPTGNVVGVACPTSEPLFCPPAAVLRYCRAAVIPPDADSSAARLARAASSRIHPGVDDARFPSAILRFDLRATSRSATNLARRVEDQSRT